MNKILDVVANSVVVIVTAILLFLLAIDEYTHAMTITFFFISVSFVAILEFKRSRFNLYRISALVLFIGFSFGFYTSRHIQASFDQQPIHSYSIPEYEGIVNSFSKDDVWLKNEFVTSKRYYIFSSSVTDLEYRQAQFLSYAAIFYLVYLLLFTLKRPEKS